jgi:hypothetical protein
MIGGWLIGRHLPLQRLFLVPVIPMAIGAVASFALMRVCFTLFGGRHLEAETLSVTAIAQEPTLIRPIPN